MGLLLIFKIWALPRSSLPPFPPELRWRRNGRRLRGVACHGHRRRKDTRVDYLDLTTASTDYINAIREGNEKLTESCANKVAGSVGSSPSRWWWGRDFVARSEHLSRSKCPALCVFLLTDASRDLARGG
ncbi:uncharacterized protein BJX67DRAFT_342181 [Aspergillus lucknowensis]|uniref:Uncharacterized protein n=1 Tax=Aspergillus lucknowensis TaxID=176173 RepID=A0ABR4M490_9EURO